MYKRALVILALGIFVFVATGVFAQGKGKGKQRQVSKKGADVEVMVTRLTQKLDLNSEQQQGIREILSKYKEERKAIKQQYKGKKDAAIKKEIMAKLKQIKMQEKGEITSLLTEEQKEKFEGGGRRRKSKKKI